MRLPQFSILTTSKTRYFCETSFKNEKLSAELTALCQCVLRCFHSISVKCFACHEKVMPSHTKCCTCLCKPDDLMLQNATLSGNQPPDLLTSLMNMSLVLRLSREINLCRSSSNFPCLPSFLEMLHCYKIPHVLFTCGWVQSPLRLPQSDASTSKSGANI